MAAARGALAPIWRELDDELHRHEASLPAGFTLARCHAMQRFSGLVQVAVEGPPLTSGVLSAQAAGAGHWHSGRAAVGAHPGASWSRPHGGAGGRDSSAEWRPRSAGQRDRRQRAAEGEASSAWAASAVSETGITLSAHRK